MVVIQSPIRRETEFVFFILTISAAEAAVGLAIIVIFFRLKDSIYIDDINILKG